MLAQRGGVSLGDGLRGHRGGAERRGGETLARLFQHHGEVGHAETQPTRLLGRQDREPPGLRHLAPDVAVERAAGIAARAGPRRPGVALNERLGAFAQELLLVGQDQFHGRLTSAFSNRPRVPFCYRFDLSGSNAK